MHNIDACHFATIAIFPPLLIMYAMPENLYFLYLYLSYIWGISEMLYMDMWPWLFRDTGMNVQNEVMCVGRATYVESIIFISNTTQETAKLIKQDI